MSSTNQITGSLFRDHTRPFPRVLPLISDTGDRKRLVDWLDAHEFLECVPFDGDLEAMEFDICILDREALRDHRQELARIKTEAQPVIIPYLLLVPEYDESLIEFEQQQLIDVVTPASVDEIANRSVKQTELEWRLRALLRLRNQSIQAYVMGVRYRSFFESIRDMILITDTDRNIVDCNRAFVDQFGYSLEEIAGKPAHIVYEDRAEFEEMGEAIKEHIGDPRFSKTVSYKRKSGEVFPGETNVFYLQDQDEEIQGFVGLIRDVSERLERERELERYEAAIESSTDMLVATDRDQRILFANKQFRGLLEETDGNVRGMSLQEVLDDDGFADIELNFEQGFEGAAGQFTHELQRETDELSVLDINYYPLRDESTDEITGVVASIRDITESEARKQELREFKQAVDAAGSAIYMTDTEGEIRYANDAFEDVTGYAPTEAIGRNPRILKSGKMSADDYGELWNTITSGESWEKEIVDRRKNGELYHASQTIAPVRTEAGDIEGFVAIQTDITEIKERQEHLLSLDRMLRHNLNNEMNVVLGRAAMIETEATPEVAAHAKSIIEAGSRLLKQADKEREIVEILTEPPSVTRVDLSRRIRSVTERLQDEYPEAVFELDLPAELEIFTTGKIDRAIEELLENAIVHSEIEPAEVQVTVVETEDGVEIEIEDDNPTIPVEERDVLDGTRQVDSLTHMSGMGLWLVKRIVMRADGTLTVATRDPQGNRVTILLPA